MGNDTTVFNPDLPFAFIGNASLFGDALARDHRADRDHRPGSSCSGRCSACGSSRSAAIRGGAPVGHQGLGDLLFVYALSGLAGLGGVMSGSAALCDHGLQIGQGYETDAIAAVILGGTSFVGGIGSIWGTHW